MTTANFIVLGSKKSTKTNPARLVISIITPSERAPIHTSVTLEYKKEIGWSLMDNMNTANACNLFSFYILHDKPIHNKAFQNLANSYYNYAQLMDKEMGMTRLHRWDITR
jgi:hypothetical protein